MYGILSVSCIFLRIQRENTSDCVQIPRIGGVRGGREQEFLMARSGIGFRRLLARVAPIWLSLGHEVSQEVRTHRICNRLHRAVSFLCESALILDIRVTYLVPVVPLR